MEDETVIIAALSTMNTMEMTTLASTIISLTLRRDRHLYHLLSSPSSFFLSLHHLVNLSLAHKTMLVAKHLLASLHHLTMHFRQAPCRPHPSSMSVQHRHLDATILLLFIRDICHHDARLFHAPCARWRGILTTHFSSEILKHCNMAGYQGGIVLPFVEMVVKCRRFVKLLMAATSGVATARTEVAAAPTAVMGLLATQARRAGGGECVICGDDMEGRRQVCQMPCKHLFHRTCILTWLERRHTCPCCRHQLPTEDVFCEIERLWDSLIKIGVGAINLSGRERELACSSPVIT